MMFVHLPDDYIRFFKGLEREYGMEPLSVMAHYVASTALRIPCVFGKDLRLFDGKCRIIVGLETIFRADFPEEYAVFVEKVDEKTWKCMGWLDRENMALLKGGYLREEDLIPVEELWTLGPREVAT